MAEHINNICNLSNIDGEKVKFITTDNYGVTQSLKNTGDIVLLRDNDRHDIYVAGEHVAGGYGVDSESKLDALNTVATTYYTYIQYLKENYDTIKDIVDEHNGEELTGSTLLGGTDTQETEEPIINIENVRFTYSHEMDQSHIISMDPFIVKVGYAVTFDNILFDISGNCNVAYFDIYSKNYFDSIREYRDGSVIYNKNYTNYVIDKNDYTITYELNASNYSHTETNGSDVNELTLSCNGTKNNYTDSILLAVKDETKPQKPGFPMEFVSTPIYWQLPYLFGANEITADNFNNYNGHLGSLVYRDDCVADRMIENEISIQFSRYFNERSHGYFACPQQWGEPKFTHKESGFAHYWEKVTTNPIQCDVNGIITNYNVYRTKIEYFNEEPITWIISSKED